MEIQPLEELVIPWGPMSGPLVEVPTWTLGPKSEVEKSSEIGESGKKCRQWKGMEEKRRDGYREGERE